MLDYFKIREELEYGNSFTIQTTDGKEHTGIIRLRSTVCDNTSTPSPITSIHLEVTKDHCLEIPFSKIKSYAPCKANIVDI